ncbi:hypothetical protein DL768_009517 [Monosporascus sp. mg162]|nr:hypothetical protein DL768_009517 [Monosporascus sp. mg162]
MAFRQVAGILRLAEPASSPQGIQDPRRYSSGSCRALDGGKAPTATTAQSTSSASDQPGGSKSDTPQPTQESPTMAQSAVPSASSGTTNEPISWTQKLAEVLPQSDKSILKEVERLIGRPLPKSSPQASASTGTEATSDTPSVTPAALPATPMSRKGAETERSRSPGTRSLHTASDAQPSHSHTAVRDLKARDRSRDQQDDPSEGKSALVPEHSGKSGGSQIPTGTRKLAPRQDWRFSGRSPVDQSGGEWAGAGTDSEGDGQDDNELGSSDTMKLTGVGLKSNNVESPPETSTSFPLARKAATTRTGRPPIYRLKAQRTIGFAWAEDGSDHAAAPAATASRSKKRRLSPHSETDSRGERSKKYKRDGEAFPVRGAADGEASLLNFDSNEVSLRGGRPGEPPTHGVAPRIGIHANSPSDGGAGATTAFRPTTASTTGRGATSDSQPQRSLSSPSDEPASDSATTILRLPVRVPRIFGDISGSELTLATKYLNGASAEELANFYGGGDSVLLSDEHLRARARLVPVLWCEHESPALASSLRDPVWYARFCAGPYKPEMKDEGDDVVVGRARAENPLLGARLRVAGHRSRLAEAFLNVMHDAFCVAVEGVGGAGETVLSSADKIDAGADEMDTDTGN